MIDKEKIQNLVREFLLAIGENPNREGLIDTPQRVANMCDEIFDPAKANAKYTSFDSNQFGNIVLVKNIEFSSFCEHHLMPFLGVVHIAYIPSDKVIGISKLARIVDKHSKKLQIQERLTKEIAEDLQNAMSPNGIAVLIEAKHSCMNIRGANKRDAVTVTTYFSGSFEDVQQQNVFISLILNTKV